MITWKREASQRTGYRGSLIGDELYKIVKYHYIGQVPALRNHEGARPGYHAYFKPFSWKNWGNSITHPHGFFTSIEDAKAECEKHLKKYGKKPNQWDRIESDKIKVMR
jgi:hypothetical protein